MAIINQSKLPKLVRHFNEIGIPVSNEAKELTSQHLVRHFEKVSENKDVKTAPEELKATKNFPGLTHYYDFKVTKY